MSKRDEIIAALRKSDVWVEDRYGHFKFSFGGRDYRLKMQPMVVRYEVKTDSGEWYAKLSCYYKEVFHQDGRLNIGRFKIPTTKATLPVIAQ